MSQCRYYRVKSIFLLAIDLFAIETVEARSSQVVDEKDGNFAAMKKEENDNNRVGKSHKIIIK